MKKPISMIMAMIMLICSVFCVSLSAYAAELDRPSNVNAIPRSTSSIRITWNAVSKAEGYYIYRSDDKDGKYEKIATVKSSTTAKTDDGLKTDTAYYYKVKAFGDRCSSAASAIAATKTHDTWGVINYVNIKWFSVADVTRAQAARLAKKGEGFPVFGGVVISYDTARDADGYQYCGVFKPNKKERLASAISSVNEETTRLTYEGQDCPDYIKVRAYKKVKKGKDVVTVYGPWKNARIGNPEDHAGQIYIDQWQDITKGLPNISKNVWKDLK